MNAGQEIGRQETEKQKSNFAGSFRRILQIVRDPSEAIVVVFMG